MENNVLSKPLLILDGGLGTTLEDEHDITFSNETPLWSSQLLITSPETLQKVQSDFAEAGAEVILTATYQAGFQGFRNTLHNGQDIGNDEARQYMLSAVDIARSAFQGRNGVVALSLGAYGATMVPSTEYSGDYGKMKYEGLLDFHRERLEVFAEHPKWQDIDIIAFETLPRLDEVKAVQELMQTAPVKPYWISCVFPNINSNCLPDGSNIHEVVVAMMKGKQRPEAIGLNCTKISKAAGIIAEFEVALRTLGVHFPRLVLYPDGADDQVYDTRTQTWFTKRAPEQTQGHSRTWGQRMAEIVRDVQKRDLWKGVFVGGCCKTTPAMISDLRQNLGRP